MNDEELQAMVSENLKAYQSLGDGTGKITDRYIRCVLMNLAKQVERETRFRCMNLAQELANRIKEMPYS